jgi:catalase
MADKSRPSQKPNKSNKTLSSMNPPRLTPRNDGFEEQGEVLTTNQGLPITDNHNSLKVGPRGPSLLEDFVLREKITSFDHERIPERVVHARGAGAFGYFECTEDISRYTSAGFLTNPGKKTPVLVRFSTVAGNRGSMDTARDVRGFATKFYTDEGNYDLVGNNIPVFFIQDAMKFPDLIHSVKGEQDNDIPQASSAHDTFWDFVSLMPESTHMLCWAMSDRAIPRSYRMMEGFGVHTFRFVNKKGEGTFVKFHWKPKLGIHGLPWEESQALGGLDPDYHRRDLWDSIKAGSFPEWELGVQLISEKDEFKFPFDLLDPTKIVPEDLVPVKIVGRLVLNRNPDNFFAEIEQAVFHPGHLVSGIDLTNDPLLQGRLFSYTDTQITRLGGPNFHELPVNRPLAPVHNNQRDGFGRQLIPKGPVAYEPNSLKGGCPFHAAADPKAFTHFTERIAGHKVRARSESFGDHFSQATLFYESQTEVEQTHIKNAFAFELSKVQTPAVRLRMLNHLMLVNMDLATTVADRLGVTLPKKPTISPTPTDPQNNVVPKNRATDTGFAESAQLDPRVKLPGKSKALSMILTNPRLVESRKVAFLVSPQTKASDVQGVHAKLKAQGLVVEFVVPKLNTLKVTANFRADEKCLTSTPSHAYDAVIVFTEAEGYEEPKDTGLALKFVGQAFKHCKTIGATTDGMELVEDATFGLAKDGDVPSEGIVLISGNNAATNFIEALKEHRHWDREEPAQSLPY